MGIIDRLQFLFAAQIRVHHATLNRAGAHDGNFDYQFIKPPRLQARQHAHLRTGFDLEYPHGIRTAHHFIDGGIIRGDILQPHSLAVERHIGERLAQGGEHAKGENIHLHQFQVFDIFLVPLNNGAVVHGGVFDGYQLAERQLGNHKTAYML